MKQLVVSTLAGLLLFTLAAQAKPGILGYSAVGVTTFAPSQATGLMSEASSENLRNDYLAVEAEAIIALETGVVSSSLQSVIKKTREQLPSQTKGLSDVEVVESIIFEF